MLVLPAVAVRPRELDFQMMPMPLPKELLEQMAAHRAAEATEASRDKVHDLILTALQCMSWGALGILCILWSAHTTNLTFGKIAFFGGIAVGNGGIIFTLLAAYRRGEKRGDW